MDTREFNKIAGAVLTALLLIFGTATFIENAEPEFLRQVSQWQTTCISGSASER